MEKITTVTEAASSFDLSTLAKVKAELGISDTDSDAILTSYIASESLKIANICNRVFLAETVVDTFRFDLRFTTRALFQLPLSRTPIVSVASVYIDNDTIDEEYEYDAPSGLLYRLNSSAERTNWSGEKIAVTYVGGYETIPADLTEACTQMVKQKYYARGRDPMLRSLNIDGVSREEYWVGAVDDGVPADVDLLLEAYKKRSFT